LIASKFGSKPTWHVRWLKCGRKQLHDV
jgi:hypothetical protein